MITAVNYAKMLLKKCRGLWRKILFSVKSNFVDLYYYGVTREQLENFLEYWRNHWLRRIIYEAERFDCDDFACLFKAIFTWMTRSNSCLVLSVDVWLNKEFLGRHACNCVYLEDERRVVLVEPQTAEILEEIDDKIMSYDGWEYRIEYVAI